MGRTQIVVAVALVGLWAAAVVISYFNQAFRMPDGLVPMALLAGGFLLGKGIRDALKEERRDDSDS